MFIDTSNFRNVPSLDKYYKFNADKSYWYTHLVKENQAIVVWSVLTNHHTFCCRPHAQIDNICPFKYFLFISSQLIHTVCGSGLNDVPTSVVAAGERGLGIGTNIYLEIRWSNRNEEKSRNVVPGTISSSLITYLVTQTLHRIGTDLILFCSLLYGLNHYYYLS